MTCPAHGDRRAIRPDEADGPRLAKQGGLWRVRSLEAARQVLRARRQTTQAGFTAEYIPRGRLEHRPILISDGPAHDRQRSEVARFFAPAVLEERYEQAIRAAARRRLEELPPGPFPLDDLALYFTVEVTAEIVGLTHETSEQTADQRERRVRAMAHRLVAFFDQPPFDLSRRDLGRSRAQWAQAARKALWPLASFWAVDVRPALRQRRRNPADDVISHLVKQGWSRTNILIEALTYGTAGMVTTREFIAMAAWHLLTTPSLADQWRAADRDGRQAILAEVIRLEPVVGHLYRRTQSSITLTDGDTEHLIPAGELVDVQVRPANADLDEEPLRLCPGRALPPGVRATGLAFGDGAHKCPGEPLALLEAEILLTELFDRKPRLVQQPDLGWDELVAGYEVRGLLVELD